MKTALLALLSAALFLALTSVATAADRVDVKRVTQSRQAVVHYWTAERMREAVPVDQTQGAVKAAQDLLAPPFESHEHPDPYPPPHGKVFFTLGGTDYVCSGTALDSSNGSVVWTAGHCVNEGPGSFATNWAFVPAYKDGNAPYGTWTAGELLTTSPWGNQGDISYDLGAAVMNPSGGSTLNSVVGGRGVAFNYARNQSVTSYGHPAAPPFSGERLWVCESDIATSDPTTSPQTMGIGCDMTGGSSGGGWVVGDSVYSVNSYGYTTQPNTMYGPYQGSVAQSLYNSASTR
jgi:hypothetical protein